MTAEQPNVVFILCDDLGWGDLGCYGHARIKTPHLDRLAAEGTLFTQFYVNGSVCSPSRAAFMTGQFPARHGIHGHITPRTQQNRSRGMPNFLDPEATMLTRLLKQAGYATGHFGKWHLGQGEGAPEPDAYGIDEHRTRVSNGPDVDWKHPYFNSNLTALYVDEAIRFVEAHRQQPFYLNLWTLLPHAPLHPTEEEMKPYRNLMPRRGLAGGFGAPHDGAMAIYYATITSLDAQIGRLLKCLDQLDLAGNTIVIFSSDNGPEDIHIRNASHSGVGSTGMFRGRKRSLYEGGIRVPLILRWPERIAAGRVDDQSVLTAVDLLPTLCNLAKVEVPDRYRGDGEDVSDIWLGQPRGRNRPIYWEWRFRVWGHPLHHSPMLAVRSGPWKLLTNPEGGRVELYNIPADPMETDNLADQHPDRVEELAERVMAWQQELPPGPIESAAGKVRRHRPRESN